MQTPVSACVWPSGAAGRHPASPVARRHALSGGRQHIGGSFLHHRLRLSRAKLGRLRIGFKIEFFRAVVSKTSVFDTLHRGSQTAGVPALSVSKEATISEKLP